MSNATVSLHFIRSTFGLVNTFVIENKLIYKSGIYKTSSKVIGNDLLVPG